MTRGKISGYCEVCGREYANIYQHKKTKAHAAKVREHETEPQNTKEETAQEAQELEQEAETIDTGDNDSSNTEESAIASTEPAGAGESETGTGTEKTALPKKKTLPTVAESKEHTVRIIDDSKQEKSKNFLESLDEMLTPEVKTAIGGLIAGAVAIGMQKIEQAGKPEEKKENVIYDLHGGAHEW
jgi:uncharacterized membrane protein